jgi:hypothetical protein
MLGATSVSVINGGTLQINTSPACLYSATVIRDSNGFILQNVAASTSTTVPTAVTFAAGAVFSFIDVSASSGITNINGLLTMAPGSFLDAFLTNVPTAPFTVNLIRFQSTTCSVPSVTLSYANCGSFTCSFIAVPESSTWCKIELQVATSTGGGGGSSGGGGALYALFALLAFIPFCCAVWFVIWYYYSHRFNHLQY